MNKKMILACSIFAVILVLAFETRLILKFKKRKKRLIQSSLPNRTKKIGEKPLSLSSMSQYVANITITIKTTKKFHKTRVELLLKTWIKKVLNQVWKSSICINVLHFLRCKYLNVPHRHEFN